MISPAEPAMAKASPNLANWLLLGLGLGGLVALVGTMVKETFDKIRPAQTASLVLPGIPAATLLPVSPRLTVPLLVNRGLDPASPFGRAIKSVHDRLRVLTRGRDSLALSIVSLSDGEGKTLLITALAQQIAAAGLTVAIIDATNKRAGLSEAFGLPHNDYGSAAAERPLTGATLVRDHGSGIDIIKPDRQMREGEWLAELIAQLRADHKIILVDLPAVMEDKRSVLLSRATDTALLVVPSDRHDQHATHALIQTMASFGRKPALAVVNQNTASYRSWIALPVALCGLALQKQNAAWGRVFASAQASRRWRSGTGVRGRPCHTGLSETVSARISGQRYFPGFCFGAEVLERLQTGWPIVSGPTMCCRSQSMVSRLSQGFTRSMWTAISVIRWWATFR